MVQIRRDHRESATGERTASSPNRLGARCHLEAARLDGVGYLVLVGELDMSCNERFVASLKRMLAEQPEHIVIDLRSVTFIDSTGLSLLVKANNIAQEEEIRLHIVRSPAEIVRAVFETSGLEKLLPLSDQPPRFRD
jgi:anti-sigma B factor antagonist